MEKEYLPISSLNHYSYCPKSAWLMFVGGQFRESADTVEGALLHERADSSTRSVLGGVVQIRTVYLYSREHRIIGIADLVEQSNREIYPVEYKKGQAGDWINHQVQLCAQALCLEEMCRSGRRIRRGFLYYVKTGRRQEVRFRRRLRAQTVQTIQAMRQLLETQRRPDTRYSRKCPRCSLYSICLPKEVETMNKRRWWRKRSELKL
jgi:CRISPR-associated exonuclease Cas4